MRHLRPALLLLAFLTVLTGLLYPLAVTGLAQVLFPHPANGSLIEADGQALGSTLIGQPFTADRYFWSRPSATSPAYNAASSTGSDLGPTHPALLDRVKADVERLRRAHPEQTGGPPIDLVTASGSGLDPHISPAAAEYQIARVAKARGLAVEELRRLVAAHIESRQLFVLGEPRVNVLELNLALDARAPATPVATVSPAP